MPQGEMSQVAADGRLGYGGACFVKDVSAKHKDFPHELTSFLQIYNERLRGSDSRKAQAPKLVEG
jgi:UDP-glucose 6-dehydrogenase